MNSYSTALLVTFLITGHMAYTQEEIIITEEIVETVPSRQQLDSEIDGQKGKIDELLRANENSINKIDIEVAELLEQAEQVVKPWHRSWQLGVNYLWSKDKRDSKKRPVVYRKKFANPLERFISKSSLAARRASGTLGVASITPVPLRTLGATTMDFDTIFEEPKSEVTLTIGITPKTAPDVNVTTPNVTPPTISAKFEPTFIKAPTPPEIIPPTVPTVPVITPPRLTGGGANPSNSKYSIWYGSNDGIISQITVKKGTITLEPGNKVTATGYEYDASIPKQNGYSQSSSHSDTTPPDGVQESFGQRFFNTLLNVPYSEFGKDVVINNRIDNFILIDLETKGRVKDKRLQADGTFSFSSETEILELYKNNKYIDETRYNELKSYKDYSGICGEDANEALVFINKGQVSLEGQGSTYFYTTSHTDGEYRTNFIDNEGTITAKDKNSIIIKHTPDTTQAKAWIYSNEGKMYSDGENSVIAGWAYSNLSYGRAGFVNNGIVTVEGVTGGGSGINPTVEYYDKINVTGGTGTKLAIAQPTSTIRLHGDINIGDSNNYIKDITGAYATGVNGVVYYQHPDKIKAYMTGNSVIAFADNNGQIYMELNDTPADPTIFVKSETGDGVPFIAQNAGKIQAKHSNVKIENGGNAAYADGANSKITLTHSKIDYSGKGYALYASNGAIIDFSGSELLLRGKSTAMELDQSTPTNSLLTDNDTKFTVMSNDVTVFNITNLSAPLQVSNLNVAELAGVDIAVNAGTENGITFDKYKLAAIDGAKLTIDFPINKGDNDPVSDSYFKRFLGQRIALDVDKDVTAFLTTQQAKDYFKDQVVVLEGNSSEKATALTDNSIKIKSGVKVSAARLDNNGNGAIGVFINHGIVDNKGEIIIGKNKDGSENSNPNKQGIGIYAIGRGSKAVNEGTINISENKAIGMYIDDGAVGENHGTIEITDATKTGINAIFAVNNAVIKNYGRIIVDGSSNNGIYQVNSEIKEKGTIVVNSVESDDTSVNSYQIATVTASKPEKSLGDVAMKKNPKTGNIEVIIDGKEVNPVRIDTINPVDNSHKIEEITINSDIMNISNFHMQDHITDSMINNLGMYVDTSGINFTKPIEGLDTVGNIDALDLILGIEATEYTNAKTIEIGENIMDPYNEVVKKLKSNNAEIRFDIHAGSLTWLGTIKETASKSAFEYAVLQKIPYTIAAEDKDGNIIDQDLYNELDGIEQRYGIKPLGSRERVVFTKLNGIGKGEPELFEQAVNEMKGNQYSKKS